MMGGQFQADGEEQFYYSSLKSIFEPTKIKLKLLPISLVPATPEITLDKPTPLMGPPTLQTPHPSPFTLRPLLSANTPDLPLTPLPTTPSPIINIPRSCGTSRVLNAGEVSTPTPPTQTSNHLAGNHPQYSGISNTDSWIPFPSYQPTAETRGASHNNL